MTTFASCSRGTYPNDLSTGPGCSKPEALHEANLELAHAHTHYEPR